MKRDGLFLIVTNKRDITSDFIIRELHRRKLPFFRLNTEDSTGLTLTHKLGSATMICDGDAHIDLKNVRAAYFRRPMPPWVNSDSIDKASAHYIREEWNYLLRSLYLEVGTKWFSHPNNIILAEDKPRQLRLAAEVGFNVPETIITNELDALEPLFFSGKVVAKPMKQSLFEDDEGPGSVIYTNTISSISEIDRDELLMVPVIFQRRLEKRYDLRVTVVEEQVFAASIDSQEFERTATDWRHSSITELRHAVFELPTEIEEACRRIVARLGLRYGAIDLVLDRRGKYWFLECNPNGQWAWIENRTALPIAAAIVDAMERMSHEID